MGFRNGRSPVFLTLDPLIGEDISSCPTSCRYSNVIEGTGLHPRPSSPKSLQQYFPKTPLCPSYGSTVYASKRGESLSELLARAELVSPIPPHGSLVHG